MTNHYVDGVGGLGLNRMTRQEVEDMVQKNRTLAREKDGRFKSTKDKREENVPKYITEAKLDQWQGQIMKALQGTEIPIHRYYGKTVRFGVLSDTHIGSLYENRELMEIAYDVFLKEGITNVYHCGDITDGEKMYRGQEYELYAHGADRQIDAVAERYPYRKGINTYFILGNHDLSFWKHSGNNIGEKISNKRKDLIYVGDEEVDILVGDKKNNAIIRLLHPHKGSAYAISYQIQKYIESLSGGQKPKVLLVGHYHKTEFLPSYRNVLAMQAGCTQSQTPFMRGRNLAAHTGFWIVELQIDENNSVRRFKPEFFAHYETAVMTHSTF